MKPPSGAQGLFSQVNLALITLLLASQTKCFLLLPSKNSAHSYSLTRPFVLGQSWNFFLWALEFKQRTIMMGREFWYTVTCPVPHWTALDGEGLLVEVGIRHLMGWLVSPPFSIPLWPLSWDSDFSSWYLGSTVFPNFLHFKKLWFFPLALTWSISI